MYFSCKLDIKKHFRLQQILLQKTKKYLPDWSSFKTILHTIKSIVKLCCQVKKETVLKFEIVDEMNYLYYCGHLISITTGEISNGYKKKQFSCLNFAIFRLIVYLVPIMERRFYRSRIIVLYQYSSTFVVLMNFLCDWI